MSRVDYSDLARFFVRDIREEEFKYPTEDGEEKLGYKINVSQAEMERYADELRSLSSSQSLN